MPRTTGSSCPPWPRRPSREPASPADQRGRLRRAPAPRRPRGFAPGAAFDFQDLLAAEDGNDGDEDGPGSAPRRPWPLRLAAAGLLAVLFGHAPHEMAGVPGRVALNQQPRVERELRELYWTAHRMTDAHAMRSELAAIGSDVEEVFGPAEDLLQSLGTILGE